MITSILSSKGQVVIPKEVREKLGLDVGDRVQFIEETRGGFKIVPATGDIRTLKGSVAKPDQPVSVEAMQKVIAARATKSLRAKR